MPDRDRIASFIGHRQPRAARPAQIAAVAARPTQIAAVAARQHRCVTRAQLLDLGFSRAAISRRISDGSLHPCHPGVYAVGIPVATALERATAAVLACGETAVLSGRSALALWGFAPWPPGPAEVTVTVNRRPSGVVVRRSHQLPAGERRRRHGIAVTAPARTVLDVAPRLDSARRSRVINDALRTTYLSQSELARVRAAHPHHPGAKLLDPFIHTLDGPTHSDWEDDFPAFCAAYGLPRPTLSVGVCGHLVDALFLDAKLIVELDGWPFHRDRSAFEADRERDADTLAGGFATIRITMRRVREQPEREARRLRLILAQRQLGTGS